MDQFGETLISTLTFFYLLPDYVCFQDEDWMDVTLEEFMACPFNLAVNRQTRMLANLGRLDHIQYGYPD